MNTELHYNLDSVVAFREQHNTKEPSLSALGLLAEWAGISGLSLSGRQDWLDVALPTVQRWSEELNVKVSLCVSPDMDLRRLSYEHRLDRVTLIPARWSGPSVVGGW
jgi:pyridoxine 5'-phosphate synthase PdxJ